MLVSLSWHQISGYPLLWKRLYLKEWTVAEDLMLDFEDRLHQLETRIQSRNPLRLRLHSNDSQISSDLSVSTNDFFSIHTRDEKPQLFAQDNASIYDQFFNNLVIFLERSQSRPNLNDLRAKFSAIACTEIGESFYRSATFTANRDGSIRLHVDWWYLYIHRNRLENNWRDGRCQATTLDVAPELDPGTEKQGIYCIHFDRKYLAAGCRDNSIRLWNVQDLSPKMKLMSHKGSVLCLQFDSKRNLLVSGSSDATINIWDLESGTVLQTLHDHSGGVLGLHFDAKYLASCSKDCTARIWEISNNSSVTTNSVISYQNSDNGVSFPRFSCLQTLKGHRGTVNSLYLKGNMLATASADHTVRLWDLITGMTIRTIDRHNRGVSCVNMAQGLLITGGSDHLIKMFDIKSGDEVRRLEGHSNSVRTIQTDSTKLISGSYDGSIRIWDLNDGKMLKTLSGHQSQYHSTPRFNLLLLCRIRRVHLDQRRIISCCAKSKIVIWDFTKDVQDDTEGIILDATFF